MLKLFNLFGNPTAIEQVLKEAIPDSEEALQSKACLETDLDKINKARNRVLDHIVKDLLTQPQAEKSLPDRKDRETLLRAESERAEGQITDVTSPEPLSVDVEEIKTGFGKWVWAVDEQGEHCIIHRPGGVTISSGGEGGDWVKPGQLIPFRRHRDVS